MLKPRSPRPIIKAYFSNFLPQYCYDFLVYLRGRVLSITRCPIQIIQIQDMRSHKYL